MEPYDIRLLALDLDGTLTNSQKEISGKNKIALYQAEKQGVRVALASGRPALGIRRLADETGLAALERFSSMVGEALAFGTPLAGALERQAELLREEQRAQVEEEIERVPVKMLVPLGTLIVPAMFLAILGPLLGSALVVA